MLIPDKIPDKEPFIRVGIILPDDGFDSVTVVLPEKTEYQILTSEVKRSLPPKQQLQFKNEQRGLLCSFLGKSYSYYRIEPLKKYTLSPECGILVKRVIAGRGFHWEKNIDVFLPGCMEITSYQGKLILVNELRLEEYLVCVATSEMSAACPSALIESQTIAARSWMLANIEQKHIALGFDVCNDDCCQRFQGSKNLTQQSINAARKTSGLVLLYGQTICDARYSKSCGGIMESFPAIWGGKEIPYLKNIFDSSLQLKDPGLPLSSELEVKKWIDQTPDVFCSSFSVSENTLNQYLGTVDKKGKYFRWEITYTQKELTKLLNNKLHLKATRILSLNPEERGGSGRLSILAIKYIDPQQKEKSIQLKTEYQIRQALHTGFLYSSCFYIIAETDDNGIPLKFTIKGAGWGHGVGYCQIGALGMSLKGFTMQQILAHYYPGSILKKIY